MANPNQHPDYFPPPPAPPPGHQHFDTMPVNPGAQPPQDQYYPPPPPQPPRPQQQQQQQQQQYDAYDPPGPALPQRPAHDNSDMAKPPIYNPAEYHPGPQQFAPPPQRIKQAFPDDDNPSSPVHYIRDPHKLIAYLVPFPRPVLANVEPEAIPKRFMIYTPPPPPLSKPAEGEKEAKLHKVQRKWQEEVRSAKTSTAKTASWKGVKSKATKGIDWAIHKTTSSNLDFLGRVSPGPPSDSEKDHPSDTGETHKTVDVEEMVLIYPPTMQLTNEQMREEFVNTMLRTKSKAQRDTVIATGLMPVAYGIDILATLVWPFGGLGEIDTVWAYSSFRGAKTARSVTKRLTSSTSPQHPNHEDEKNTLRLTFTHSQRLEVLRRYLDAECHKVDAKLFPRYEHSPTESDVLEAIGWAATRDLNVEERNWEDEHWEMQEVKEDVKRVFKKAAAEWKKWCELLAKNPEKAMKK